MSQIVFGAGNLALVPDVGYGTIGANYKRFLRPRVLTSAEHLILPC